MGILRILWPEVGLSILVECFFFLRTAFVLRDAKYPPPELIVLTGERGIKMKKILCLVSLVALLLPTFVSADCAGLSRFTHWVLETSHSLVFYAGPKPLARLEIPNCEITPSSKVLLRTSYVCDMDEIEIDGVACHILTVEILN